MQTFETEEEINQDIKNLAKSLLQMAKCVKESINHLKNEDLSKAKFALISREWEFAEMDYAKHNQTLGTHEGLQTFEGDCLDGYKALQPDSQFSSVYKPTASSVEKLFGYSDPFAGITESVMSASVLVK